MNVLHNLARVATATTGTGTITLGVAVAGFLTFAQAGVPDAAIVTYAIKDGVNSEIGQGQYTVSGATLSRDTVYRSTGAANVGKITLSGSAQVFITPAAEDFKFFAGAVPFAGTSGFLTQDSESFSFDDTTNCLRATNLTLNAASAGQLFNLGGTLTTAGGQLMNFSGTLASSLMSAQYNLLSQPVFIPSGASPLIAAYGIFFAPSMGASAISVTTMHGMLARLDSLSGYSGVIANGNAFTAFSPILAGSPITVYTSYYAATITNGQGITSGTVLNFGFRSQGITASAASGGTCFNYGVHILTPAGTGAGTNHNYGLFITGNGAGNSNYSIYVESTSPVLVTGQLSALYLRGSTGNALTAVGTNRATALQLAAQMNNITVAATGTGAVLPVGVIGMEVDVFAAAGIAAATIQVYALGSETIDTVAGSTGVVLTKAKRCRYKFVAANTWISAQWGVISA